EPRFPFVCKGPSGELLGTHDFVVGYSTIYAYASYQNQNPIIDGFRVKGVDMPLPQPPATPAPATDKICVGDACLAYQPATCEDPKAPACATSPTADQLFGPIDCTTGTVPCVTACADDGAESCPGTPIEPIIDPASTEPDQISSTTRQRNYFEEQWIDYYVSRGKVK